jgi:hypothetical protein
MFYDGELCCYVERRFLCSNCSVKIGGHLIGHVYPWVKNSIYQKSVIRK